MRTSKKVDSLYHKSRPFANTILVVLTLHSSNGLALHPEDGFVEDDGEDNLDSDNDDNITDVLLESIKDIIDRLFRLATKLRSPETRLRSSRAQKFQKLDDGVDLFNSFHNYDLDFISSLFRYYRSGPTLADDNQNTSASDVHSKLHVADDACSYLIQRLALANVARRRQFAYWEHHRLKLDRHTEAAIAARKALGPTEPTSVLPTPFALDTMKAGDAMTISTATQLLRPTQNTDDLASIASVSEYMPTSAAEGGDMVTFPSPPRVALDSKFFECPYCFTTCARKILNVKAWRYVCPVLCHFALCSSSVYADSS